MDFYQDREFNLSCLDGECDGEMELDFTEKKVSDGLSVNCPECEHRYDVILHDFEDTPENELTLKVYA